MYGFLAVGSLLAAIMAQTVRANPEIRKVLADHGYASDNTEAGVSKLAVKGTLSKMLLANEKEITIDDEALAESFNKLYPGKDARGALRPSTNFSPADSDGLLRRGEACVKADLDCEDHVVKCTNAGCACIKQCGPHGVGCSYGCL